jgi:hypothetical protein
MMRRRSAREFRRGDIVRVKRFDEILSTLDDNGDLAGLPFMPEMLEFCGRELRVSARSDKTCDTVHQTGTTRRMRNTVHLSDARCDGSAHGGCQAGCLLFWREEWLERREASPSGRRDSADDSIAGESRLVTATQANDLSGATVYRCQATQVPQASEYLRPRDPSQYLRDVRTRNLPVSTILIGLVVEVFNTFQDISSRRLPRWLRLFGGRAFPFYRGTGTGERTPTLGLQPAELVEVKGKAEIMRTLDRANRNRGMWFDSEMLRYCGERARVERKVDRIIDERTGKMMKLSDCVVLSGVVCEGRYHRFCQRQISPYWREAWLRKVDEPIA